jgi:uncharacterized protein YukE
MFDPKESLKERFHADMRALETKESECKQGMRAVQESADELSSIAGSTQRTLDDLPAGWHVPGLEQLMQDKQSQYGEAMRGYQDALDELTHNAKQLSQQKTDREAAYRAELRRLDKDG